MYTNMKLSIYLSIYIYTHTHMHNMHCFTIRVHTCPASGIRPSAPSWIPASCAWGVVGRGCVCVSVCLTTKASRRANTHACMHAPTHTHTQTHTHRHTHTNTHTHPHTHTHLVRQHPECLGGPAAAIHPRTRPTHLCMRACMRVSVWVRACVRIYMHACTHVIHPRTQPTDLCMRECMHGLVGGWVTQHSHI